MGEVRCGKTERGSSYPSIPGFTIIPAWSRGKQPWNELSPMHYDPMRKIEVYETFPVRPGFVPTIDGTWTKAQFNIFENYWQFSKIFHCDLIDVSKPITVENLKDSFWQRRVEGMNLTEGKRRALPKAQYGVPISSYYRGRIMDYISSRHYVYAPLYQRLYSNTPTFLELKRRHDSGENLLIVGPDGGDHTIPLTLDYFNQLINDSSKIFGHELVLCAMLLGKIYPTYD